MARSHAMIVLQGKVASKPKFRKNPWGADQALFLLNVPHYRKDANDGEGGYVKNLILIMLTGENARTAEQLADGEWLTLTGTPDIHKWTEMDGNSQEKKLSRFGVRTYKLTRGGNTPVNQVMLVGNVGEVRVNYSGSGRCFVGFGIATERWEKNEPALDRDKNPILDDKGKPKMGAEVTSWTNVSMTGDRAEKAGELIKKGGKVAVSGYLETRTYEDRDGKQRQVTDLKSWCDYAVIAKPASAIGSYSDDGGAGDAFGDDWGEYDSGDPGFNNSPASGSGSSGDRYQQAAGKASGRANTQPPPDFDDEIPF